MWAISIWSTVLTYNILVLSPADGHGEKIPLQPYIEELLKRGHFILHVTSKTFKNPQPENYSEILFDQTHFKAVIDGKMLLFFLFLLYIDCDS